MTNHYPFNIDPASRCRYDHRPKCCDTSNLNYTLLRKAAVAGFGSNLSDVVGTDVLPDEQFETIVQKLVQYRIADARERHKNIPE